MVYFCLTNFLQYSLQRGEISVNIIDCSDPHTSPLNFAHAFKFVENAIFFVGENNIRSQKATEKIGGIKSGMVKKVYGNRPPSLNVRYVIKKPRKEAES